MATVLKAKGRENNTVMSGRKTSNPHPTTPTHKLVHQMHPRSCAKKRSGIIHGFQSLSCWMPARSRNQTNTRHGPASLTSREDMRHTARLRIRRSVDEGESN